jgi:hypothetical protein
VDGISFVWLPCACGLRLQTNGHLLSGCAKIVRGKKVHARQIAYVTAANKKLIRLLAWLPPYQTLSILLCYMEKIAHVSANISVYGDCDYFTAVHADTAMRLL